MMTGSIDLELIEGARIHEMERKSGKKARFFKFVLIPTPGSDRGDFIVKQATSAEERERGAEMPILGDVTDWSKRNKDDRPQRQQAPARRQREVF